MTTLVYQTVYKYKFVLGGEEHYFHADGYDDIVVQFKKKFPEFELKMHDECPLENVKTRKCPDRAQVHYEGEVTDLLQLNFTNGDLEEIWMWVS